MTLRDVKTYGKCTKKYVLHLTFQSGTEETGTPFGIYFGVNAMLIRLLLKGSAECPCQQAFLLHGIINNEEAICDVKQT